MSTNLNGTLDLAGTLVLREKVLVGGEEVLVELSAGGSPPHGIGIPVLLPPPPATPKDPGKGVWIDSSDNASVLAGDRAIVTSGTCVQGDFATWPGDVLPSKKNQGVRIAGTAVCVVGDAGKIREGGPVTFDTSGQG